MPNRNTFNSSSIDNHDHMKKWFGLIVVALLVVIVMLVLLAIRNSKVAAEGESYVGIPVESGITVSKKESDWLSEINDGYASKDDLPDEINASFDYKIISTIGTPNVEDGE